MSDANLERVWERLQAGHHAALVGVAMPVVPGELRLIRVSCDVPPSTLGPLHDARGRLEAALGEAPILEQARDRVLGGLRRHLLGASPTTEIGAVLVGLGNRLAELEGRRTILVFEAVEAADAPTLAVLQQIVARPGWMRLPILLRFRVPEPAGDAAALLRALVQFAGADAVVRVAQDPATNPDTGVASLHGLAPESLMVLRAGALIGTGFEVDLCAALLEVSPLAVLLRLQAAVDHGVPLEDRGEGRVHMPTPLLAALQKGTTPSLSRHWHRRLVSLLGGEPVAVPANEPQAREAALLAAAESANLRPPTPVDAEAAAPAETTRVAHAEAARTDAAERAEAATAGRAEAESSEAAGRVEAESSERAEAESSGRAEAESSEAAERAEAARRAEAASEEARRVEAAASEEARRVEAARRAEAASGEARRVEAAAAASEEARRVEAVRRFEAALAEARRVEASAPATVAALGGAEPAAHEAVDAHRSRLHPAAPHVSHRHRRPPRSEQDAPGGAVSERAPIPGAAPPVAARTDAPPVHEHLSHRHRRRLDTARAASHLSALDEGDEAAARYIEAAREAAEAGHGGQGLGHGRRALAILERLPPTEGRRRLRIAGLVELARIEWRTIGEDMRLTLETALTTARTAQAALLPGDPPALHAEVAVVLAGVAYDRGDLRALEEGLRALVAASQVLLAAGDARSAARLLNDQAEIYIRLGDHVQATHLLMSSRKVFETAGDDDPLALRELGETHHLLARVPLHAPIRPGREGDALSIALDHALTAEKLLRRVGDTRGVARVWETMGRVEIAKRRLERAGQRLGAALEVQRSLGDAIGMARTTAALADLLAESGQLGESLGVLAASIGLNREKGSPLGLGLNRRALQRLRPRIHGGEEEAAFTRVAAALAAAEALIGHHPLPEGVLADL